MINKKSNVSEGTIPTNVVAYYDPYRYSSLKKLTGEFSFY